MKKEDNAGNKDTISGLCPKVKALQRKIEEDIQDEGTGDPWWCGENGKLCNFPFNLTGRMYYKPVTIHDVKKCTTDDNTLHMKTPKEYNESQLVPCSPCPGI